MIPWGDAPTVLLLFRVISMWLIVLGVCIGTQVRTLAEDPCEVLAAQHQQEHGDHEHEAPCDSSHDEQCPLDHHHHGNCMHCMPMTAEIPHPVKLSGNCFSLAPIRSDAARAPDAPCTDLDKPPLI